MSRNLRGGALCPHSVCSVSPCSLTSPNTLHNAYERREWLLWIKKSSGGHAFLSCKSSTMRDRPVWSERRYCTDVINERRIQRPLLVVWNPTADSSAAVRIQLINEWSCSLSITKQGWRWAEAASGGGSAGAWHHLRGMHRPTLKRLDKTTIPSKSRIQSSPAVAETKMGNSASESSAIQEMGIRTRGDRRTRRSCIGAHATTALGVAARFHSFSAMLHVT